MAYGDSGHTEQPSVKIGENFIAYRKNGQWFIKTFASAPNGLMLPGGTTYNTASGEYELSFSEGPLEKVVAFAIYDSAFDLSGDGRFSAADVDLISGLVGLSPSGNEVSYDLNQSGVIDQDELEIFQAVVAAGYDSRRFGDADGDGSVCFSDNISSDIFTHDYVLGQPEYNIALDYDLNGILDSNDAAAWADLVQPTLHDPDYNQDGVVDTFDVSSLIDTVAGGSPPSNIDPDYDNSGNVDQQDIDLLIGIVAGGTCAQ